MRHLRRLQRRSLLAGLAVGIVVGAGLTLAVVNVEEIEIRLLQASYDLRGWRADDDDRDRVLALRDERHHFYTFEDLWPELRRARELYWLECSYGEGADDIPSSQVTVSGGFNGYTIIVPYKNVCLPGDDPIGTIKGTY